MELIYETGYTLHEHEEWLPGTLVGFEDDGEGMYGPSMKWKFILDEDIQNGEGRESWAWSAQKVTDGNRTGKWIRAINPGVFPSLGQPVDLTPLVNARVDVMFEPKVNNDGSDGERIVKVRASKVPAPDPADDLQPFDSIKSTPVMTESGDDLF